MAASNAVFGFSLPNTVVSSIAVSRRTGRIFVGDVATLRVSSNTWTGQRVLRFPDYFTLVLTGQATSELQVASFGPRSIVLDGSDNLMVFDTANRAAFHFPLHEVRNWASDSPRVAPNLISNLRAPFVTFAREAVEDRNTPWKKSLADIEVLVNGAVAPITRVQQDTIRLMVPATAPTNGRAEFVVRRTSTGEVLAQNFIQMFGNPPPSSRLQCLEAAWCGL